MKYIWSNEIRNRIARDIVGGAAEKYARARSGDTTFFISLQTEHKKQGEET